MVAHIIHDVNNKQRHDTLIEEIKTQGFEYTLWPHVKGPTPSINIVWAHKQIIRYAIEQDMDSILIMEDDVAFTAPMAFDYFINNTPLEFDLYLAGIYSGRLKPDGTVNQFSSTHCYIVHSRFYEAFLMSDETMQIDVGLSALGGLYKVCMPMVAFQHPGFSENTGRVEDYSQRIKSYKKYGI